MKLVSFIILTLMAVIYAGLVVSEGMAYDAWQNTLADQKEIQAKVLRYQRLNSATQSLLKRLAVDSQRDPALAELLKRHDIHVDVKPLDFNQAPIVPPDQGEPDKSTAAPATPTPGHP